MGNRVGDTDGQLEGDVGEVDGRQEGVLDGMQVGMAGMVVGEFAT